MYIMTIYLGSDISFKLICKPFPDKIVVTFLASVNSLNISFGCLKEQSHSEGYIECPKHIFWLATKKIIFRLHTPI